MSAREILPVTQLSSPNDLRPLLFDALVDFETREPATEEIEEVIAAVPTSEKGLAERHSVFVREAGSEAIAAMMTAKHPDEVISSFAKTANPIELTDAYVHSSVRGSGIGRTLVRYMEEYASNLGHTEILIVSGPRFQKPGWPFWTHLYGPAIGIVHGYFVDSTGSYDGRVWRKELNN